MTSRKPKSTADPSLAYPHQAGSTVLLTQLAVHPIYGTIMFSVLDHTDFYFKEAKHHLEEAKKHHEKIFSLPVGKSNCRLLTNNQLQGDFFLHAQSVVIFSYLALEYFAMNCSRGLGKYEEWLSKRLDQKIKDLISQELHIPQLPQDLCTAFGDLENRRHALNHPEMKHIVNGSETQWDTVHVSWLLIGNYEKVYANTVKIYEYLNEPYMAEMAKKPPQTLTFTIERGLGFKYPTKKP